MELSKTQEPAPAKELAPQDSIRNDKVICLECGAEMRQLTQKHLVFHGMDQKEYKKKHGFPMKTRLAAESLVEAQIKAAKKRGLPKELQRFMEARRQAKAEAAGPALTETVAAGKPKRTRLRKKKAV